MIIALIAVLALNLALLSLYVAREQRRRRPLPQLSEDWWPHFERQFHDYVSRIPRHRR